jgi:hypothetical protein
MENRNDLEVWRLAPLHLMWCIWRERNARSFEDRENALLELKNILQSLYTWIAAFKSLPISTFMRFLDLCSSFSLY